MKPIMNDDTANRVKLTHLLDNVLIELAIENGKQVGKSGDFLDRAGVETVSAFFLLSTAEQSTHFNQYVESLPEKEIFDPVAEKKKREDRQREEDLLPGNQVDKFMAKIQAVGGGLVNPSPPMSKQEMNDRIGLDLGIDDQRIRQGRVGNTSIGEMLDVYDISYDEFSALSQEESIEVIKGYVALLPTMNDVEMVRVY